MTQKELNNDAIMAILNGYSQFRMIGSWKEELRTGRDSGLTLELVEIQKSAARFLQVSFSLLDEEDEATPLLRGKEVWLRINRAELVERI